MIQAWYDPKDFPGLVEVGAYWRDILEEFALAVPRMRQWGDRSLYSGRWEVYGLYDLPDLKPIRKNIEAAPITTGLINRFLPGHGTVAFAVLGPLSRVYPHTAHPSPFVRAHLGLRIPTGDCKMWVSETEREWSEGEWIVFNEHLNHSAWNRTREPRIVLIVDVPYV